MTIELKPEIEALIQEHIQRGPYRTTSEFVEQAVRMLHQEEELWAIEKEEIGEKIERGLGEFERGEYLSEEESRARRQEHKATWLAQRLTR
jgi:putative addiction module CopG family antidote